MVRRSHEIVTYGSLNLGGENWSQSPFDSPRNERVKQMFQNSSVSKLNYDRAVAIVFSEQS